MESSQQDKVEFISTNPVNRYLTNITSSILAGGAVYSFIAGRQASEAWLFRDDIGSPYGIKGYEEQVNSVGMHHGHCHWPSNVNLNTWNSATYSSFFF